MPSDTYTFLITKPKKGIITAQVVMKTSMHSSNSLSIIKIKCNHCRNTMFSMGTSSHFMVCTDCMMQFFNRREWMDALEGIC